MACGGAKWSKHVHSNISGTQGVNTTSFCAGTQAMVLGYQVWTATFMSSPKNRLLTTMEDKNPWNGYEKPSFHSLNLSSVQM